MARSHIAVIDGAPGRREIDDLTLRRAQQGEHRALEHVIERYQPMVHAMVWRMAWAGGASRVDDLVQDVLVRVLRGLPRFDPGGPARLSTWILTIATRVVLNDRRKVEPKTVAVETASFVDPTTAIADAQVGAAIAAAVGELPEAQRIVFVLREYHELEYAEIAAVLEIDLGTVKSRLARARIAVRDVLARRLPDLFGGKR
jgi:RNA polymerase sigma-70 factor (ECF subfamily)